jgi:hypothetical protein
VTGKSHLSHSAREGVSAVYIDEARDRIRCARKWAQVASNERDLADYTERLIQEVYDLRSRVAYLEGWKESAEAADSQRKRA